LVLPSASVPPRATSAHWGRRRVREQPAPLAAARAHHRGDDVAHGLAHAHNGAASRPGVGGRPEPVSPRRASLSRTALHCSQRLHSRPRGSRGLAPTRRPQTTATAGPAASGTSTTSTWTRSRPAQAWAGTRSRRAYARGGRTGAVPDLTARRCRAVRPTWPPPARFAQARPARVQPARARLAQMRLAWAQAARRWVPWAQAARVRAAPRGRGSAGVGGRRRGHGQGRDARGRGV
jgi:hypothetical protein